MNAHFNPALAREMVEADWQTSIRPALEAFIRIPAKSPAFDRDWADNGHIDAAVALAEDWCRQQAPAGSHVEVVRLKGRTPLLWVDVPGTGTGETLLYGHLDKQPEASGWDSDKGPWTPVVEGDRLYGRGAADDGYAVFASLEAVRLLHEQGIPHPRCMLLIECAEESGSPDLPAYIDYLGSRLGQPGMVVCLDSGCANYEQLWVTTSLRGMAAGDLTVRVLEQGVHSGDAGGVVPSSFRIARALLDRIEDAATGAIRLPALQADVPAERQAQAQQAAEVVGGDLVAKFPWASGTRPSSDDTPALILNRTWYPALEVIGADGLPSRAEAGNVLRSETTLRLSLRLPPTVDADAATRALESTLTADPPQNAEVGFRAAGAANGWNAPAFEGWLGDSLVASSDHWFGKPAVFMGEGGSIPLMNLLGRHFPAARFLVTGVLGPGSNAHGPNEFLHMPMAKRLSGVVAEALAAQAAAG
ncbi:M20/M25/M40 family metallo-hydrolase [Spiribacter vilamensis]|uniref:Acetylornithine deacetylase/succinyl-diaminopimelate desuccinylase-like protein n=1 Tax=Spiribacter vilamensis TaxID=531306 RepID=A0A4Q8CYT4_9GAMM|nr:M20/M25/M40 family metallo-hydrolase [Spiribacter vilamensis]RZU98060.1 acetylornithine deacetylase/succinyl-diaminopimelate desuccinylase-like protein [Spiribacter vilamensis]TVO61038.1 M20/M25/M40 family metallo-hydrolase [Spiribacter vilamensis]